MGINLKPTMEIHMHEGSLEPKEHINWIDLLDKYFEHEEEDDEERVTFYINKFKDCVSIWWDGLLKKRIRQKKFKIRVWDEIVGKMKGKCH